MAKFPLYKVWAGAVAGEGRCTATSGWSVLLRVVPNGEIQDGTVLPETEQPTLLFGSEGHPQYHGRAGPRGEPPSVRAFRYGTSGSTSTTNENMLLIAGAIAGGKNAETVTATKAAANEYSTMS